MRQIGALMSSPRVTALLRDERVMNTLMAALAARGRLRSKTNDLLRQAAHALRLATRDDVKELQRTIRQLETLLAERGDGKTDGRRADGAREARHE